MADSLIPPAGETIEDRIAIALEDGRTLILMFEAVLDDHSGKIPPALDCTALYVLPRLAEAFDRIGVLVDEMTRAGEMAIKLATPIGTGRP
jgi:hypothetical protein